MNMLGRQIPLKTARKGGYFFTMNQSGVITATLDMGSYFDPAAAADLPKTTNWLDKARDSIARMYLNNQLGDCVIASLAHISGVWTANALGTPVLPTDAEINAIYRIWNPRGDNGCDISTVNNYWRDHGVTLAGQTHKIDSYISIDNTNFDLCRAAIADFMNVKLGIDLPSAWDGSSPIWDVTNTRVVGGHDVPGLDYIANGDSNDGITIATWGGTRRITKAAWVSKQYITESYVCLSKDMLNASGVSPNGFDLTKLMADLASIKNGQIPSVGPPEVPLEWLI